MGFKFRLESVMKYRQRIVDQQGREVGLAQAQVGECRLNLEKLERELTLVMGTSSVNGQGNLKVQDMVAKTAWLEHLRQKKLVLLQGLNVAESKLQVARSNLKSAWQDLEVLAQLKKRQGVTWNERIAALERKELDEIGQVRAERARQSDLARSKE